MPDLLTFGLAACSDVSGPVQEEKFEIPTGL